MAPYSRPVKWIVRVLAILVLLLLSVAQYPVAAANTAENNASFLRFWPIKDNPTKDATVAVDATGGIHLAFSAYTAVGGVYPAYYDYCANTCDKAESWSLVAVGNVGFWGGHLRLAVDGAGRPRMLWYQQISISGTGTYQYAECNTLCNQASSWNFATLHSDAVGPDSSRYFALDPQGHPRFLYTDTNSSHTGTFYVYCDTGCTDSKSWQEVKISDTFLLYDFSLVYAPSGSIRLAYRDASGSPDKVGYAECSSSCANAGSWIFAILLDQLGSGGAFSLAIDTQGRPRLALYSGYLGSGDPGNDLLYYLWCDTDCLQSVNWGINLVGLAASYGKSVDLAINAQGQPVLAYYIDAATTNGLGYGTCTADCNSTSPTWQTQMVESSDDLDVSDKVPVASGCSQSYWLYNGIDPSLAIDGSGQPRIGYTARHYQGGSCTIHEDLRLARFALTASAPQPSEMKVYLPLVKKP